MTKCTSYIRGRRLRVTRLDGCGNPVPGPDSVVVTKGFISVGFTANTEEGEAISVTNANGDICVSDTPPPKFTGYGLEISLCGVDPNLVNLLTGQPLVYDDADTPEAIGFDINSDVNLDDSGFAIELWTGVPAAACEPGQSAAYGYLIVPFVKGGVLGDFTVENNAVNFVVTGAQSKDGAGWGVGPYDILFDSDGQASPQLTPIPTKNHLRTIVVNMPPPDEACGATALGSLATGATAGAPGLWTPSGSYAPADLADLIDVDPTASPATAWTSGQYVVLRDGSRAHWDSTDWVADEAP